MAIQSESRRPLYNRLRDDLINGIGVVKVTDYTDEFGEYKDFPSGTHLINPMTNLLAYLARPESSGVRKDLGLTTIDGKGAVLRVGPGKYRWYPENYWKDSTTLYINFIGGMLPNVARLKKYNPYITFVERPVPAKVTDMFGSKPDATTTDWIGMYNKMSDTIKRHTPPNPATRVVTIPPPAITHYGHDGKVMAPLAEVIHHEADTLIVKVDGKVLVCKIQTEVK